MKRATPVRVWAAGAVLLAALAATAAPIIGFACGALVAVSTSPSSGPPGSPVVISVQGVYPSSGVTLSIGSTTGAPQVLWSGVAPAATAPSPYANMVVPVAVPQDPPGVYVITARVTTANPTATFSARVPFQVTASPSLAPTPPPPASTPPPASVPMPALPPAVAFAPAAGNAQQTAGTPATVDPQTGGNGASATNVPSGQALAGISRTSSAAARVAQVQGGGTPIGALAGAAAAVLVGVVSGVVVMRRRRIHRPGRN